MKKKISITIDENLLSKIDTLIDSIYIRNRSQAIEYLASRSVVENRTAVILAGGNEENRKINGKYRFEYALPEILPTLKRNHFKNVFIIAQSKALTKAFDTFKDGSEYGLKIEYILEKKSDGSFSSLKCIKGKLSSRFLCIYCDVLLGKINIDALWNEHILMKGLSTIMMTTSNKPSEKGTLKVEGNHVLEFMQKPKNSDIYLVFSPIFVCEPEVLNHAGNSLETDLFPDLAKKSLLYGHLSSEKEHHIHSSSDIQ